MSGFGEMVAYERPHYDDDTLHNPNKWRELAARHEIDRPSTEQIAAWVGGEAVKTSDVCRVAYYTNPNNARAPRDPEDYAD